MTETYITKYQNGSSHVISYKIEPDVLFYLIDIIEDVVLKQMQISTAKL